MVDKLSAEMLGAQLGNAAARIAVGMTGPDPAAEFHQAALAWKRSAENWKSRAIREQKRKEEALEDSSHHYVRAEAFLGALQDLKDAGVITREQANELIQKHRARVESEDPRVAELAERAAVRFGQ